MVREKGEDEADGEVTGDLDVGGVAVRRWRAEAEAEGQC